MVRPRGEVFCKQPLELPLETQGKAQRGILGFWDAFPLPEFNPAITEAGTSSHPGVLIQYQPVVLGCEDK